MISRMAYNVFAYNGQLVQRNGECMNVMDKLHITFYEWW